MIKILNNVSKIRNENLKNSKKSVAFFDLDGVLWNDNQSKNILKLRLNKKVKYSLRKIKKKFDILILISNQTYGARNFRNLKMFEIFIKAKFFLFLKLNTEINAVYLCPHHPFATSVPFRKICNCRKPYSGLFKAAGNDFNIDFKNSIMVGDKITDLYASSKSDIKTNFLIENLNMFDLGINPEFNFQGNLPYFKFVKNIHQIDIGQQKNHFSSSNLHVLYLSAGKGTRLLPLTLSTPKPLLELNGKSILESLIKQIHYILPTASHIVNISYMPEQFVRLSNLLRTELDIIFSYEPKILGSANSVMNLAQNTEFSKDILVLHGDLLLSDEYIEKLSKVLKNCSTSIMINHIRTTDKARSNIEIEANNIVKSFTNYNNPNIEFNLVNSGIYFFKSSDLAKVSKLSIGSQITDSLLNILVEKKLISSFSIEEKRISIDSIETFQAAKKLKF
jgi:D-glycero-D-manno-heptose 1,7-bisphosphate phosphatase